MPSPACLGELHEMARMVLQGCCLTTSPSLAALSLSFPMTDDSELHIMCQAPYLQVGQKVCINSPLLASLLTASSTSFSLYTVHPNDSLALISSRFIMRCTTSYVSPAAIAAANNIVETSPLVANTQLIIPCDVRVGILDCGCAQSLPVCGADYIMYPSYCDALCNYALPVIQDGVCTGCNAACTGRTGLAPAGGYGCTWSTCPYPNWKPLDCDCTVLQGDTPGKCCVVEQTVSSACAALECRAA
ncbi:unnamed protein product [Closterium sp. Naga37s-1]|nr:unnamed protein product [Closterium sp. Naga37s-1]